MAEEEKRAPDIRFQGFFDDWEQRELGDITSKIGSGKTPRGGNSVYTQNGIPLLRSQNIYNDRVNIEDIVYITESMDKEMANSRVEKNDVLLNITGASIGRSAVYELSSIANVNQHVCIIRPIHEIHSYFVQLNLSSPIGQKQIDLNQAGGGREGLNFQQIAKMSFNFPTYSEQKKLGVFFKQLDDTIDLHLLKQRQLELLKQCLIKEIIPQKDSVFPHLRLANFRDPWEQHQLKDVLKVNSGRDYKHLDEGNIPVYGTGGYMLSVDGKLSDVDGIGLGRKGTIDKPQYLKAPFWTVDTLFYLTPFPNYDIYFLYTLIQSINWKSMDESTGVPSLSKSVIERITLTFPILEEQRKIGFVFKQLDDTIALHQQKVAHLKTLKGTLLNKMFI